MAKQCAVCGDTCEMNVRLAWRRDRDGRTVNVCMACREAGRVNENSIDNYCNEATEYVGSDNSTKAQATMGDYYKSRSNFAGGRGTRARRVHKSE